MSVVALGGVVGRGAWGYIGAGAACAVLYRNMLTQVQGLRMALAKAMRHGKTGSL